MKLLDYRIELTEDGPALLEQMQKMHGMTDCMSEPLRSVWRHEINGLIGRLYAGFGRPILIVDATPEELAERGIKPAETP